MPYARLLQVIRVSRDAKMDEFREAAMWSYRTTPPTVGKGTNRQVVPFENWFAQLSGRPVERKDPELPEISDEEIEFLMKAGRQELRPPSM